MSEEAAKLSSYPKVMALGHRAVVTIFDDPVLVEEKIDGSQISFGVHGGELLMKSKGARLMENDTNKMFINGVNAIVSRRDILEDGYTYRGEYLQKPKHNTLTYGRIPHDHIIIFDIEDSHGNPVNRADKEYLAKLIDLECVPAYDCVVRSSADIDDLLGSESVLGGDFIEGIVVKNPLRYTSDGKYMVAKYVSEKFKERHNKDWKARNPNRNDVLQHIVTQLRTDARFQKGKQHLQDNGIYTGTPKDIGPFMKELHTDIDTEEKEWVIDQLMKHFMPQIKRGVCAGAAEWYKRELMEGQFEQGDAE